MPYEPLLSQNSKGRTAEAFPQDIFRKILRVFLIYLCFF